MENKEEEIKNNTSKYELIKVKKYDKKKDKNRDIDIELFNPLKEAARKLEEEKKKKNKSSTKIVI